MNHRLKILALAAWTAVLFYPALSLGQTISFAPMQNIPDAASGSRSIVAADFNRDGKLDFAVASLNGKSINVVLGHGNGTFDTPSAPITFANGLVAIVAADFNNDGMVDLAVADSTPSSNSTLFILLGNGDGTFAFPVSISLGVVSISHSIAVGDFNRDGNLDMAVTSDSSQTLSILIGDGGGLFSRTNQTLNHSLQYVVAADFDRDGILDLAVADTLTVFLFPGVGNGTFAAGIDIVQGSSPGGLAVGDFDGDGILDLAVSSFATKKVFIRRGLGDFSLGSASFAAAVSFGVSSTPKYILAADLNGDGNLDLLTASASSSTLSVLPGLGNGTFGKSKSFTVKSLSFFAAIGDFDGDGRPDILAAIFFGSNASLLLNTTPVAFSGDMAATPSPVTVGSAPRAVATADFNRDGDLDLAVANSGGNNVSILLGAGGGGFGAPAPLPVGPAPAGIAIADFNRDGKPDMVVANSGDGTISIFVGDGAGAFAAASTATVTFGTAPVAAVTGDWDGDGKQDLAVVDQTENKVFIFLGNGDGTFGAPSNVTVGADPSAIAVGDFNRDGIPDLAVTNSTDDNVSILLGDGLGAFTQPSGPFGAGSGPSSVATGDFDGDGVLDLAVANSTDDNVSILLGGGDGTFGAATNIPLGAGTAPSSIVAGDFNRDGKLDLAVANKDDDKIAIFIGNGSGAFDGTLFGSPFSVGDAPSALAGGDYNNDGRPDLAVVNEAAGNVSIMLNIPPSPVILSPTTGETWNINTQRTIKWVLAGVGETVNIQLSRDAGTTWTTIFKKSSNDGIQTWTVTGLQTTQARIRVCSTVKLGPCTLPSGLFAIAP